MTDTAILSLTHFPDAIFLAGTSLLFLDWLRHRRRVRRGCKKVVLLCQNGLTCRPERMVLALSEIRDELDRRESFWGRRVFGFTLGDVYAVVVYRVLRVVIIVPVIACVCLYLHYQDLVAEIARFSGGR